ncbi:MAG: hypothetical protein FJ271_23045 [Planctomycetes bacterium]|nr:hypothetical protein [Planctomycetota bacterium]
MKKIILASLFAILVIGRPCPSPAQQRADLDKLMYGKLASSKAVFEGIALADFNKISGSAEKLIQISKMAEWAVFKTPQYELYTNEFRRAAGVIGQKARNKNLDGVALAYFDMTMSCIRCHQYVREVREARLPHEPAAVAKLARIPATR